MYPTDASLYPANVLRNIALEPVRTPMVFLLDIDLVPDVGFYAYVKQEFRTLLGLSDSHVFTIPAFQVAFSYTHGEREKQREREGERERVRERE